VECANGLRRRADERLRGISAAANDATDGGCRSDRFVPMLLCVGNQSGPGAIARIDGGVPVRDGAVQSLAIGSVAEHHASLAVSADHNHAVSVDAALGDAV
jgi:hypothetical protein